MGNRWSPAEKPKLKLKLDLDLGPDPDPDSLRFWEAFVSTLDRDPPVKLCLSCFRDVLLKHFVSTARPTVNRTSVTAERCLTCEHVPMSLPDKMNVLSPAEKMEPDPLLGPQETQVKQNGTTHVTIAPDKSSKSDCTGLSWWKPRACCWAVLSVVLNLILIIILIIQPGKQREPCPATPACPVAACPDGWVGNLGKCYYFSEAEANWTSSQNNCSALNASLAGIDTQQEMDFLWCYKGLPDYWIGLHRDPGQPWKWTNGTKFNNWFTVVGGEECAFMNHDIVSSSCSREGRWICSK